MHYRHELKEFIKYGKIEILSVKPDTDFAKQKEKLYSEKPGSYNDFQISVLNILKSISKTEQNKIKIRYFDTDFIHSMLIFEFDDNNNHTYKVFYQYPYLQSDHHIHHRLSFLEMKTAK